MQGKPLGLGFPDRSRRTFLMPASAMCGRLRFGKGLFEGAAIGRVLPCVRPVDAASVAAGPNAIRRTGSQSKARAQGALAKTGFPGPRSNRLCITSHSPRRTVNPVASASSRLPPRCPVYDRPHHAAVAPRRYARSCWPAPPPPPWWAWSRSCRLARASLPHRIALRA